MPNNIWDRFSWDVSAPITHEGVTRVTIPTVSDVRIWALTNNPESLRSTVPTDNSVESEGGHTNRKRLSGLSFLGNTLGSLSSSGLPGEDATVREGIRSAIGSLGPWGAVAAAATGVVDAVGEATGLNLDTIDVNAAEKAGIKGGALANKYINMVPGMSMLVGAFGGNTSKSNFSSEAASLASGYSGAISDLNTAQELGNKRMTFGRRKANRFINNANRSNELLTNMAYENKRRENNYAAQLQSINNVNLYNGYTPGLSLAKKGGHIPELDIARSIILSINSKQQENNSEPQQFQLGGKMNMIVTGALHARKHNLEELNPVLEGEITKKGIPVVTFDEGGEVNAQLAEVETEEMILEISATKTLEDYYKDYMNAESIKEADNIALECGKFLVDQILKNTDDPDKLIKKTE